MPSREATVATRSLPGFAWRAHHVGLSVADLDASVAWYGRMFGFEEESRLKIEAIPATVAFIRCGDFRVELFQVPGARPLPDERRDPHLDLATHGCKHICLETPDVPAAVLQLRQRGADIVFERTVDGNRICFIRDNTGNLIELIGPFNRAGCGSIEVRPT